MQVGKLLHSPHKSWTPALSLTVLLQDLLVAVSGSHCSTRGRKRWSWTAVTGSHCCAWGRWRWWESAGSWWHCAEDDDNQTLLYDTAATKGSKDDDDQPGLDPGFMLWHAQCQPFYLVFYSCFYFLYHYIGLFDPSQNVLESQFVRVRGCAPPFRKKTNALMFFDKLYLS